MTPMKVSCSGEIVIFPPRLPAYLSDMYDLKPIVGTPVDEDVKTIHAAIRSQNTIAHLPAFFNPDLSMQLSQHLFGAQLAVYRASYSMTLLPGDENIYIPPAIPAHIPGTLNEVVGAPSDEDIKSVQGVIRSLDNLANSPQLFDADLSMKLSQHMFNLQFARYMQDSTNGHFVSEPEPEEPHPAIPRPAKVIQDTAPNEITDLENEAQNIPLATEAEQAPKVSLEPAQLGETIVNAIKDAMKETNDVLKNINQAPPGLGDIIAKSIKDATSETKKVLENMNRMLMLIKTDQCTVGGVDKYYHIYKDPLNQQGMAASEYGLPRLRFGYYHSAHYGFWLDTDQIARYLRFFGVGADLVQAGEEPHLIAGKQKEAEKLLFAQIGIENP